MMKETIHILHLEDVFEDAELARIELDGAFPNIEIEHVTHKQAYSEALRTGKADLIISDYDVPGFSGIESLEMRNQELPEVPFVFLSGVISEERALWAMRGGASDYVMKGSLAKLPMVVDRLLQGRWEKQKRKEAQADALVKEQRYQELFQNASDAIFIFNADTKRIEDANDEAQRYLGYKREELIGFLVDDLTPEKHREFAKGKMKELLEKGSLLFEHVHQTKAGKEIPVMISSKLLNLGGHKVMQAFVWDLTEQKKKEEEMRVRDRAFASVGEGIMITDPKQNDNPIIYCNEKFLDITGYSSNEVIGRNPRFLQGEKSDKTTKSAINKAIRDRVLFQGELENYRKDGTTYWCEVTITPVFDDHGELQNYIGLQRDITAKKAAEKAIKDAELRFRTLFEQSPDGIVIMDPETLCPVSFNTKAHEQLGYSAEEFSRSKVTDADPRSVKEIMAQAELILRTGKAEFETQLRKSGGELMDVQVTAVLMELQDSPVIYSVYRDITKRKRNEQELKRLSLVASSVENAVYITDPEFNSVWVNKSFEQLTGFSMDELQDKKPTAFYNAEAFKSPNVEEWMKSLFQGLSVSEELWLKRKDGLRYWAQVHATPVMNEHGKVEQIIAIMSNIPVRKKAEMQRDDLLKSLEEKVIERTEELTEANISLENRNKDISDSINYAKYIQDAFIPALKAHDIHVNGAFVVNRPKDVLSGDFHWHYYSEINNCSYVALGDCTGHGVPGSLMTMLAIQLLEQQIVGKEDTQNPKTVLEKIDKRMIDFLHQDDSNNNVADGMEVVLIRIDHSDMQLIFSHVGRSVYFNMNGELKIFDRTNEMVGGPRTSDKKSFSLNRVPYERGYRLYAFSDGLADQFGGPSGKKFLRKRVRDLLLEIQERPFEQHRQLLDTKFTDWKGDEDQVDDVIMLGLEL